MKAIISFLILLITLNLLFGQNWNNSIQTFGIDQNAKLSSFVDARGIHISYVIGGNLRYALLRPDGQVIKVNKVIANNNCYNSVIMTDENLIYVLFKQGNSIKLAKSSDLGENWLLCNGLQNVNYTIGDKLDALVVRDSQGEYIYFVFDEITFYNSLFYRYNPNNCQVVYLGKVNSENEPGRFPSLARSSNKIHILYFASLNSVGDVKVRDFNLQTFSFEPPTQVPRINSPINPPVWQNRHYITTTNNKVHVVYTSYASSWNNVYEYVGHFSRDVNGTVWTEHSFNSESNKDIPSLLTSTYDNNIHLIYFDKANNYLHKKFNGQSWSTVNYVYYSSNATLKSNSNDLYLCSVNQNTIGNPDPYSVYLRQYDAAPLAPVNVSVSAFNGRPKIVWSLNNEPDVRINNNAYYIERRLDTQGNGQWSSWVNIGSVNGQTNSFIDSSITSAGSGPSYAQYRLRAKDIGGNFSAFSTTGTINYGDGLEKISIKNFTFELIGNYPNPFNPNTKIMFTIPEPGNVELVFYNSLGETIKNISLNGLTKGEHQYILNSEKFGMNSGIYFYSINFNGNYKFGKMILVK
jgi:hypothetical protein